MATRTRRTAKPKELRGELIEARTIIRFSKSGKPQYQYILKFQDGDRIVSHTVDERTYTLHVAGVPVKSLRQFEGTLSDEDAEAMLKAIEEAFGRADE
jgi:hypothetical protein